MELMVMGKSRFVSLSADDQQRLIAAARTDEPVRGLTHGFYKYPARFSPIFARAAIDLFTEPGDLVLDPHVGGGTTIVEALASGREAIGVDISELAEFVALVKSTVYSDNELDQLERWAGLLASTIDIHKPTARLTEYDARGYYKHIDHRPGGDCARPLSRVLRAL